MSLLTVLAAGLSYYPLVLTARPAAAATIGSEQALAAHLAAQIDAQGNRMSLLAEQYDQATINANQVNGQLTQAQKTLAQTRDKVNKIQVELRHQAVAAYVQDGSASQIQALLQSNQSDVTLKQHYLVTAAGDEQSTVNSLNLARQALNAKKAALSKVKVAADKAVVTVSGAQHSAASEAAQERATLSQVKGTLATMVAQAQAQQEAAQAQRVQTALAAQAAHAATVQATQSSAASSPNNSTKIGGSNSSAGTQSNSAASNSNTTNSDRRSSTTSGAGKTSGPSNPASNPVGKAVQGVTKAVTRALPSVGVGLIGPRANIGTTSAPAPSAAGGAGTAIAWAQREIGKPYVWAGAGPDVFDCSGLIMYVWGKAGVSLPHSAQGQYDATAHVPISALQPGDLVFYDSPVIGHVGIYVGGGQMIVADHTGTNIRYASIFRPGIIGGGRP